jgi:hypothetical protein
MVQFRVFPCVLAFLLPRPHFSLLHRHLQLPTPRRAHHPASPLPTYNTIRASKSEMPKAEVTVNDDIPTSTLLAEVSEIEVLDIKGEKVKFGKLIQGKKTIVVFIRTSS